MTRYRKRNRSLRYAWCPEKGRKERGRGEGKGVTYSPVTSTAMPNVISIVPNGRAYDPTAIPLLEELFTLVLTETRKGCTRATWTKRISKKKNKRKEEMKTGRVGEDVPTPADANERLVRTYAKKVRSVSESERDSGRD